MGRSELVARIRCSADTRQSSLCICMNNKESHRELGKMETGLYESSSLPVPLPFSSSRPPACFRCCTNMMVLYDLSNLQAPARLAPVALPLPTVLVSPHADKHLWIIHSAHNSSAALATTVGQGHFSLATLSYPPCR